MPYNTHSQCIEYTSLNGNKSMNEMIAYWADVDVNVGWMWIWDVWERNGNDYVANESETDTEPNKNQNEEKVGEATRANRQKK